MFIISLYSYYNIKNQLIQTQLSHLEAITKLKSMQISDFYSECENDLETIINSPYTKEIILSDKGDNAYKTSKLLYDQQLNDYIHNHDINDAYIIDLNGKIIASAQKSGKNAFSSFHKLAFEEGKTKIFFSNIYLENTPSQAKDRNTTSYSFTASAPLLDYDRKTVGVVVVEFNVDDFFTLIQDYTGLGHSGETLLGKQLEDKVIFLNPLRHDSNAGMRRSVQKNGKIAIPMIRGSGGLNGSGLSVDYRGIEVFAAWRYVPDADWGLVAKIDKDEALKPLKSIRNSIFVTGVILLLFGIVVSLKLSDSIVRPVDDLETDAHEDPLTRLPNRKLLMELLDDALKKAKIKNAIVAVLFLDLDGFKTVNDTYGHEVGDLLLKNVALRLTNCIRQSDTVGRLGGDEFVVLLCGAQDINNISKIALHIINAINEDFSINDITLSVGASIGISIFPINATGSDEMMRQADKAMYYAKHEGKNNFKFYDETCPIT